MKVRGRESRPSPGVACLRLPKRSSLVRSLIAFDARMAFDPAPRDRERRRTVSQRLRTHDASSLLDFGCQRPLATLAAYLESKEILTLDLVEAYWRSHRNSSPTAVSSAVLFDAFWAPKKSGELESVTTGP